MATSSVTSLPASVPKTIGEKLRRLRRRIALWFAVDGFSRLLALLLALIAVDLGIDWLFAMDRPQRGVMLFLALAALAAACYRWLVHPLAYRFSDDTLCLLVEKRNRQLGESLISALQFSRGEAWKSQGISPALVAATIRHGAEAAAPVKFQQVLRTRAFALNLALALALMMLFAATVVAIRRTETMSIWFDRNVLLQNRAWPQDFYLSIDAAADGVLRVPRGEDWPLGVTVRLARGTAAPPDEMQFELRDKSQDRNQALERTNGGRHFNGKLIRMVEPVEIRATSRRVSTPWIKVLPVDRPAVVALELSATLPKYAGGQQQALPTGRGPYALLPGTRLLIRGTADKALSSATLVGSAQHRPFVLRGPREFELELRYGAQSAGVYGVELTDTERMALPDREQPGPLRSREPTEFTLVTLADGPPRIKARLSGVSGIVVPRARLPLSARIESDHALIQDARLTYQWHGPTGGEQSSRGGERGQSGVARPKDLAAQLGRATVDLKQVLDLEPLKIPVGSDLNLVVEAVDNNDVSGPRTGKSVLIALRVVNEDELRTDLFRREREQRLELERLVRVQVGVVADSRELLHRAGGKPSLTPDQQDQLVRTAREEKQLGASIGAVARRIGELLTEAKNNRLDEESGALEERLRNRIQTPLQGLAEESVPEVLERLAQSRRLADRAAERDQALSTAVARETQIEARLGDVLKNMIKVEDFQVVLGLLLEIQRTQSEILTKAEKERQEEIKRFLEHGGKDDGGRPSPPPEMSPPPGNGGHLAPTR